MRSEKHPTTVRISKRMITHQATSFRVPSSFPVVVLAQQFFSVSIHPLFFSREIVALSIITQHIGFESFKLQSKGIKLKDHNTVIHFSSLNKWENIYLHRQIG
jgi:hypothetical protein